MSNQEAPQDTLLAEFRRRLAEPGPWRARFNRLGEALIAVDEAAQIASMLRETEVTVLNCDTCEELLDIYVDDELAGVNVRQTYPAVWQHLNSCSDCQMSYSFLSDVLAPEEEFEEVPEPEPLPVPENPVVTSSPADMPWGSKILEGIKDLLTPPAPQPVPSFAFAANMPPPAPTPSKTSYTTDLWQDIVEGTFRLEFTFNLAYLQSILQPPALALRAGPTIQPTSHLLLYNTVSVGEQMLTVEVTATPKESDTLTLQALVSATGSLPSNLSAVLTWVDQIRSVTVNEQGWAELGDVSLDSLQAKEGHFGIALVSGDQAQTLKK